MSAGALELAPRILVDHLRSAKGEVGNQVNPLRYGAALYGDKQFVDSPRDGCLCVDDECAWHRLALRYSVQGKAGDGTPIMSEQYPALLGRPIKNRSIVGLPEPHVLNADQIDSRQPTDQAAYYVVVEVLVTEQTEQSARL